AGGSADPAATSPPCPWAPRARRAPCWRVLSRYCDGTVRRSSHPGWSRVEDVRPARPHHSPGAGRHGTDARPLSRPVARVKAARWGVAKTPPPVFTLPLRGSAPPIMIFDLPPLSGGQLRDHGVR